MADVPTAWLTFRPHGWHSDRMADAPTAHLALQGEILRQSSVVHIYNVISKLLHIESIAHITRDSTTVSWPDMDEMHGAFPTQGHRFTI